MHAVKFALAALAATAVQASAIDSDEVFAVLLKRQEPGTPAYNCHDNCGQAIIQAREDPDICEDDGFLSNYANCLQCAGPDNVGIWQYYGNSLSKAGESCGLDTEPAEGKQPDVGEAVPADDGGSSAPSESTGVSPPASESEASAPTTESEAGPEPTESDSGAEPTETSSDEASQTESEAEAAPTTSDDEAEASPTDDEEKATSTDDSDAEESDDADASSAPSATSSPEVDAAGSLSIGFAGLGAAAAFAVLLV